MNKGNNSDQDPGETAENRASGIGISRLNGFPTDGDFHEQKRILRRLARDVHGAERISFRSDDKSLARDVAIAVDMAPRATDRRLARYLYDAIIEKAANLGFYPARLEKMKIEYAALRYHAIDSQEKLDAASDCFSAVALDYNSKALRAKDPGQAEDLGNLAKHASENKALLLIRDHVLDHVSERMWGIGLDSGQLYEYIMQADKKTVEESVENTMKNACRAGVYREALEILSSTGLDLSGGVGRHYSGAIINRRSASYVEAALKKMKSNSGDHR